VHAVGPASVLLYRLSNQVGDTWYIGIPEYLHWEFQKETKIMKKRFVDVLSLLVFLLAMAFSQTVCADSPALEYLKTNLTSTCFNEENSCGLSCSNCLTFRKCRAVRLGPMRADTKIAWENLRRFS